MPSWVRKPLTSKQAIALLEDVTTMPAEVFYELSPTMRRAAFTMAKVHDAAVLNRIKREIVSMARSGWDEAVFADWLETQAVEWNRSYSRLVYRNATQNAYNVARFRVHMRPDFVRRFPALVYDAVMDSVTSPFCKEHNNRWWWRRDFPVSLYPPNHHNCRSVVRAVSKKTTTRRGWDRRRTVGAPMGNPDWPGHPPAGWQNSLERRLRVLEGRLRAP